MFFFLLYSSTLPRIDQEILPPKVAAMIKKTLLLSFFFSTNEMQGTGGGEARFFRNVAKLHRHMAELRRILDGGMHLER